MFAVLQTFITPFPHFCFPVGCYGEDQLDASSQVGPCHNWMHFLL